MRGHPAEYINHTYVDLKTGKRYTVLKHDSVKCELLILDAQTRQEFTVDEEYVPYKVATRKWKEI